MGGASGLGMSSSELVGGCTVDRRGGAPNDRLGESLTDKWPPAQRGDRWNGEVKKEVSSALVPISTGMSAAMSKALST